MSSATLLIYASTLAQAVLALLLGVLLRVLYSVYRRDYLRQWTYAWMAMCVSEAGSALGIAQVHPLGAAGPGRMLVSAVTLIAGYWQAAWLLFGMYEIANGRVAPRTVRRWILAATALAALALLLAAGGDPARAMLRYALRVHVRQVATGLAYLGAAYAMALYGSPSARRGRWVLGGSFALYGGEQLHYFAIAALGLLGGAEPAYSDALGFVDFVVQAGMGLGMVICLMEEDRTRAVMADAATSKAEESMLRSEAGLAAAVASSEDAMATLDRDLRITTFNPAFARGVRALSGCPALTVGQSLLGCFDATAARYWGDLLGRAMMGERVRVEVDFPTSTGARTMEVSLMPIRVAGAVSGVVILSRDVTTDRQAALALRRSEEHFRSLIQNASDLITVLAIDGTIRYMSPSAERVIGWTPDELIGRSCFELTHADDVPVARRALARLAEGGAPGEVAAVAFRFRHRDGGFRLLDVSGRVTVSEDGDRTIIVNARDVTDRRQLEEQLLQAQKLESIGRLAGGVAHDFNNLLTAMLGHVEMALAMLPPDAPAREDLREVEGAGRRAAGLTRQLLAFARRQDVEPKIIDLNTHVSGMTAMLRRLIGEHIELHTLPGRGLWRVRADPGQIEQVLMNLAVNAHDAMPQGGKLIIETANIALDESYVLGRPEVTPGEYVVLVVSDTGVGMEEEVLRHAFEPFFTTKPSGEGTGLGLAMCYGIVKQAGGHIWVYSEPGMGTTFRIYLPRARAEMATRTEMPEPPPAPRGSERILLVEDELLVRSVAARILRAQGYEVLEAEDGVEGLRLFRASPDAIDLVLTDVVMPGMGGRELWERVRELRSGARVLFMSGYTEAAFGHLDGGAEGVELLQKPFSPGELARRVRASLDRRRSDPGRAAFPVAGDAGDRDAAGPR